MTRDFDMEKVLDKMRELREKRDLEILDNQFEKGNQGKVLNVIYIGEVEINGEPKKIFKLSEERAINEKEVTIIEKYYTEDNEIIAGNNLSDEYKQILLSDKYKENNELLEQLQEIENDDILDLNQIEIERLEKIATALGLSKEEIEKLSEIKDDNEEKEIDEIQEDKDERTEFTKTEVNKITSKTEINSNQKVTDKDTIGSLLNVQGKGYTKIAVVYSDKLPDNNNTTRFTFVGINADGSAEKIDTLDQRYGKNPNKEVQEINRDGSKIEEEQVNSIFQIKGRDEEQIAVDIGSMGTIEIEYIRTPREDNEEAISIPIETNAIRPTTREVRELMNPNRNPRVKEETDRIREHKEMGCEDVGVKDIDDNPNNDTHQHMTSIDDCAQEIINSSEEIDAVFTQNEVKERIEKFEKESESIEEAMEKAKNDLELDAQNFKTLEK